MSLRERLHLASRTGRIAAILVGVALAGVVGTAILLLATADEGNAATIEVRQRRETVQVGNLADALRTASRFAGFEVSAGVPAAGLCPPIETMEPTAGPDAIGGGSTSAHGGARLPSRPPTPGP